MYQLFIQFIILNNLNIIINIMIRSSYKNRNLNYGDIFETILFLNKPKSIL